MGFVSGWLMNDTNEKCKFEADPDVSGLGVRIGFAILPAITATVLPIMWLLAVPRVARTVRCRISLRWKYTITHVIAEANALQLSLANVYLFVTLTKANSADWFHMRFLLDAAMLCGFSTAAVSSMYPKRSPRIVHRIAVLAFGILFLIAAAKNIAKLKASRGANPGCYDEQFVSVCLPFSYCEVVVLSFVLLYSNFLHCLVSLKWAAAASKFSRVLSICACFAIILVSYFSFADYEDMKKLLKESEEEWNYGQVLTPFFAAVGIIVPLWAKIESELGETDGIEAWCIRRIFGQMNKSLTRSPALPPELPEPQMELQELQPIHAR
ncbi:uncharacterized protein PAC_16357 [Phialocephala subalpina]|uniref:Uncharacterized protein n=1 Tax=Phialocephala subalpina TaxID=576137 RepID=A0A1L7XNF1_9HELO|nr:uncharacterized protein PAC_16357 [Phialocephala subalpina]